MKALSVRQPWTWLICAGLKDVENRTWGDGYRGPLLLHASKTVEENDRYWLSQKYPIPEHLDTGAIIGAPVRIRLRNPKGADPAEWPAALRVQEWPAVPNLPQPTTTQPTTHRRPAP